jgi:DNA modification methylase
MKAARVQILKGDCRDVLRTLEAKSVHCCVTSPPYWGLRDYGVEPSIWGGDAKCRHDLVDSDHTEQRLRNGAEGGLHSGRKTNKLIDNTTCKHDWEDQTWYTEQSAAKSGAEAFSKPGPGNAERLKSVRWRRAATCKVCGAWRGVFGLEPTYQLYVEHAVEVFREVHRVLRDDGTLWLNLGDSYATGGGAVGGAPGGGEQGERFLRMGHINTQPNRMPQPGLKPKDLAGIPWRVAFALQADGWYLRQDIIWSKPNPMPESVTDRCTKAHEYLFLLSKNERYFYDQDAIMEPVTGSTIARLSQPTLLDQEGSWRVPGKTNGPMKAIIPKRSGNKERKDATLRGCPESGVAGSIPWEGLTRNKRSVWEVVVQPFGEAHFATFPPALVEPCILAGCPEGGTVLDPFGGAGTVGLVCDRLKNRNSILIDLNAEYTEMAMRRIKKDAIKNPRGFFGVSSGKGM